MRIPPLLKTFLSVKTAFKRAVSLSKLEGKVSPLTLRHTAATWLMQIGVSTWDAAGFLGMSEKTLRDVYGHHHPDYLQGGSESDWGQEARIVGHTVGQTTPAPCDVFATY